MLQRLVHFNQISVRKGLNRLDTGKFSIHLGANRRVHAGRRGGEAATLHAGQGRDGPYELRLLDLLGHLLVHDALVVHLKEHAVLAAHDERIQIITHCTKQQEPRDDNQKDLGVGPGHGPKIL